MKKAFIFFVLVLAVIVSASGQDRPAIVEGYYTVGDQTFSIVAGSDIPLFFTSLAGDGYEPASGHLKTGAAGTLEWGTYLNNNLNVGGSLGIAFLNTVNNRTLYLIPMMATGTWYFHADRLDFPVGLGLGAAVLRLDEDSAFAPLAQVSAGALYNYNQDWAFGIKASYMANAELYGGNLSSSNQIAHYAQVGLTALYHF